MANKRRGEVALILNGEEIALRPTFEACCEIEGRTGLTLAELGARAVTGRLGLQQVAVIIWAGHRAVVGDDAPALAEIGGWVMEAGYSSFLVAAGDGKGEEAAGGLCDFLSYALGWAGEDGDEKKSAKTKSGKKPTATGSS